MNRNAAACAWWVGAVASLAAVSVLGLGGMGRQPGGPNVDPIAANAQLMLTEGRQTFRFDTFGDEAFWGGTLRLHETVAQLSPTQALGLGLKVDIQALPANLAAALRQGRLNLNDPAVTLTLLRHNAVLGVRGFFTGNALTSIGITCALCHSRVDDSVTTGVGKRLDGWPNRDLDVGAIIASAPDLTVLSQVTGHPVPTLRATLQGWGRGKFDAEFLLDGILARPGGGSAATLLPPAYGMAGVNEHTWTAGP
jgi:hypothetical protein